MIATSWNDDSRPPTFHGKFLDLHLNHLQNGLYLYPPEQLDNVSTTFSPVAFDVTLCLSTLDGPNGPGPTG